MGTWSFASAFVGAILGGFATVVVQFFKYSIDGQVSRCSDLIVALRTLADLSSEYWLSDFATGSEAANRGEAARKGKILEAKIRGYQKLVLNEIFVLSKLMPDAEAADLRSLQSKFIDAISGGDFGDREGKENSRQSIAAHVVCNEMIHVLQSAKVSSVSMWHVAERLRKLFEVKS